MDIEYWIGIGTLALIAGMYVGLQRHRYSTYVAPEGWLDYQLSKVERDWERDEARYVENKRRWEKCKAIEDAAWRRYGWDEETLIAWMDLFRNVHGVKYPLYVWPLQFRYYRAALITGDRDEIFLPNLPEPLPTPQEMWAIWERRLLTDASLKPQLDDTTIGIPSGI